MKDPESFLKNTICINQDRFQKRQLYTEDRKTVNWLKTNLSSKGLSKGGKPLTASALTWEHQSQSHSQSGTPRGPLPCWWTGSLCCPCHNCTGARHLPNPAEMWSQIPWRKGNAGAPAARGLQRRTSETLWTEERSGWKLKKQACGLETPSCWN